MQLVKNLLNWIFFSFYILLISFIIIEIIFNFLPVSNSLKLQPVNKENPIYHFAKNRNVTLQIGSNFSHVNSKKVNNYGFLTDEDFLPKKLKNKKLIVVIGDSYVEAKQVKNSATFHSILNQEVSGYSVYPLGASGAPLSQYLAYADFAQSEFGPNIIVFLIYSNDFDESWYKIKSAPGFHYFKENGDLHLIDYSPSVLKRILRKSAFIRYLVLDLKIVQKIKKNKKVINNNYLNRENLGEKSIDLFLKKINKIKNNSKVIVMLDGDRNSIYNGKFNRDNTRVENRWFKKLSDEVKTNPNLHLLDLQNVFLEDWRKNHKKFNYEYDGHWNEWGHRVAGDALKNLIFKLEKN